MCLRLAIPPVWKGIGNFGIVIDEETASDTCEVVQGMKVLLIDADLHEQLANAVLDFKEIEAGAAFTLDIY